MPIYYSVEITRHDDPDAGASFYIRPPVAYISEQGQQLLTECVRKLITNRMGHGEDDGLWVAITHNLPDRSATVGRAEFRGLELATGTVVLQQALELALNGSLDFVSPTSPLLQ
jgi:hypothetical protein